MYRAFIFICVYLSYRKEFSISLSAQSIRITLMNYVLHVTLQFVILALQFATLLVAVYVKLYIIISFGCLLC